MIRWHQIGAGWSGTRNLGSEWVRGIGLVGLDWIGIGSDFDLIGVGCDGMRWCVVWFAWIRAPLVDHIKPVVPIYLLKRVVLNVARTAKHLGSDGVGWDWI